MTAIATRDLTCIFNHVVAIDNLNLKVENGTIYGLIGPNGAGKTTTLRMLSGLLEPTSGEIRINQLNTVQYRQEIQWLIGYMPDFFGVYEDLLVWEYLDFFARCYKLSAARRQRVVDDLLNLVDLTGKRNEYVHRLSRGMRQRLCLAHALVHDPQILLLDEPASGLDPRSRLEMRELLRELKSMGKTIFLSSHILKEIGELCDKVGIIENGRLIATGELNHIRAQIKHPRKYRLLLVSNHEQTVELLSANTWVKNISSSSKNSLEWEFSFSGDSNQVADLLAFLVSKGLRVLAFNELLPELEEIYMMLTNNIIDTQ